MAAQWTVGPGKDYSSIQSAIDNNSTQDGDVIMVFNGTYSEDVKVNKRLTIQANNDNVELRPTNTGFTVINDSIGDGSGTLITGFKIKNSAPGIGVNVTVNNCKIENNHISGGLIGISAIGNSTIIKGNIISNIINKSIIIGQIDIINSSGNISLLPKIPVECLIDNNSINGGIAGISAACNNITIINNVIAGESSTGIESFGIYPIISGNKIIDMVGNGAKKGITIASIALNGTTGLKFTGNTLYNINSTNNTTIGIDIFAMSMDATLDGLQVIGNTISNIVGISKTTAISIVALALGGDISSMKVNENNFSNIYSQGINSTCKAIDFVALALDDSKNKTTSSQNLTLYHNNITGIYGQGENSSITGISFFALSKGNASISDNNLSEFKSDLMATAINAAGVDFSGNQSGNQSNLVLDNNLILNINANNITSGIQTVMLGDVFILHNSISGLSSAKSKYILTQALERAIINGNNLEGNGAGEGIAVRGNDTTINYNRIVNFDHYIQNINFTETIEFFKGPLPSDDQIREYIRSQNWSQNLTDQDIDDIINSYHQVLNSLDNIPSNTTAFYNWYGTNDPNDNNFFKGNGTLVYSPWLVLNINADPSTVHVGQTSTITADVYRDSAGNDHSADWAQFFSGPEVTFNTNLGNVGSKSITVPWINGLAVATLIADEGAGIATIMAVDYQTVQTFVTILGESGETVTKTIGMQETGIPVAVLILAILTVLSGLISKRN